MLPPGLLMVHDASRGGQHHCSKLSGGQQVVGPLLNILQGNVESAVGVKSRSIFLFSSVCAPGRDDAALVKPAGEVDHNFTTLFPSSRIISHLQEQDCITFRSLNIVGMNINQYHEHLLQPLQGLLWLGQCIKSVPLQSQLAFGLYLPSGLNSSLKQKLLA